MQSTIVTPSLFLLVLTALASVAVAADPWADGVVDYVPAGAGGGGFDNAANALGEPTRFTSPSSPFGGPVTPFNAPFGSDELVSIGEGGSLTVSFDEPIVDDPANPFGIDLLIFGNSFLGLGAFPADGTTTATGVFSEGGSVSVSADGVTFVEIIGVEADGLFPTLGFTDVTDPFPAAATQATDFTLPVNPSATVVGLNTGELVALYNGSGGGAGVDLAVTGLTEISFVRIDNPIGSGATPEIDGFADVAPIPEPAAWMLMLPLVAAWRRR
ncbi:MAG: hypothetical protein AAFV43_10740 [Planctomycetota bacterium]